VTSRGEVEVRHGYSIEHIDRLTRVATKRAFGAGLDPDERYAAAWHGVVVALCESSTPPSPRVLIRAGGRAILQAEEAEQGYLGYNQRDVWAGSMASGRFAKYWTPGTGPRPEDIIDPIAMRQILPRLSELERQALMLLALLESYADAAAAAGVSYSTFHARLIRARTTFFKLWFQPETPSRMQRDQRVPSRRGPA
jgi:hypothetical protein